MFNIFSKKERKLDYADKYWAWFLGSILLVALVLRLINICAEPYWADEVLSLDIATKSASVAEMVHYLADVEFHPPLYYLILRPWVSIFGPTELATRSLSLLFSLGVVIMGYLIGLALFKSRWVGLVSAGLLAILPIQIEFGQEARPYAMICFFGALAMWFLWRYLNEKRLLFAGGYVVASLIGIYLHYSILFVPIALAGWWLIIIIKNRDSSEFVRWLVSHAIMFIGFLPWAVPFLSKIFLGSYEIFGLTRNTVDFREPHFVEQILHQLIWLTKENGVLQIEIVSIALFKLLAIGVLVMAIYYFGKNNKYNDYFYPNLFLVWLIFVPLILYVASPQSTPYAPIFFRHAIFTTVPLIIVFAGLLKFVSIRLVLVSLAVFVATLIPSISRVLINDALYDYDFRLKETIEIINENYIDGDILIIPVPSRRSDIQHYLKPEIEVYSLSPYNYYNIDIWNEDFRLGLIENEIQVRAKADTKQQINNKLNRLIENNNINRVWLYSFSINDSYIHNWFQDRQWRWVQRNVGDILRLDMYARK